MKEYFKTELDTQQTNIIMCYLPYSSGKREISLRIEIRLYARPPTL